MTTFLGMDSFPNGWCLTDHQKAIYRLKIKASISSAASGLLFVINPRYGLHFNSLNNIPRNFPLNNIKRLDILFADYRIAFKIEV